MSTPGRPIWERTLSVPDPTREADDPWTVPPSMRPTCTVSGKPCTSWTCLVDECADKYTNLMRRMEHDLLRETLIALCERAGHSTMSSVDPGSPARNYELALRLGVGKVFGLPDD